jgi:hypothetical protein
MFGFVLFLTASLQWFPPTPDSLRACTTLAAVEADTTVDVTPTGPSPLLHQRSFGGPRYPTDLRNRHVEGDVRASFVVDTLGRVLRGTTGILDESHHAFGESVCEYLRSAEFAPIVLGGRRVSVRFVGMGFHFRTRGE